MNSILKIFEFIQSVIINYYIQELTVESKILKKEIEYNNILQESYRFQIRILSNEIAMDRKHMIREKKYDATIIQENCNLKNVIAKMNDQKKQLSNLIEKLRN